MFNFVRLLFRNKIITTNSQLLSCIFEKKTTFHLTIYHTTINIITGIIFWLLKQHLQKSYLHQICCFDTINPSCSIFWFNISIILMKKWTTCSCTCSFFKTILNNQKMAFSSYIFVDFVSQYYHLFIFFFLYKNINI